MIQCVSTLTESNFVWEPVTPRGVASFSRASFERLLVVQAIMGLSVALIVVWVVATGFSPTISQAIQQLPDSGQIVQGELAVLDDSPQLLAEGHFLAFIIDGKHTGLVRSPAQFQFEFGGDSLLIFSLFGVAELDYPSDRSFYFNRTDLEPKWGAWAPDILGLAGIGVFVGLLLSWNLLATLYCVPVWLVAFLPTAILILSKAGVSAGAALMPGALLMALSLWLYGVGAFDLVKLCFAFGMHLVIGWIYLLASPLFVPRTVPPAPKNPFFHPA